MTNKSALQIAADIKAKKISATEVVRNTLDDIKKRNNDINAFLTVSADYALKKAKEVDAMIASGKNLSPLAGVPIAIKDNISTLGIETTCASKMLEGYIPPFNATVINKLEAAGLVIVGKLNMDEFAMGGSTETGFMGVTRNPYDKTRVAGGSSGGSAVAVAAGLVPLALGSDTGGSIRQPSSFCGVYGFKPTYGAVSRYGVAAFASSMDQVGPIAGNIDDCAALLEIISGPDERDTTNTIKKPFEFKPNKSAKLDGLKIGLPRNYVDICTDVDVKNAIITAAKDFEKLGAKATEFDMPYTEEAVRAYSIIACAEGSSNMSKFDGLTCGNQNPNAKTLSEIYKLSRAEGFGAEVKRRIMIGSFVLSSGNYEDYFAKAQKVRTLVKDAYNKLFAKYDIILAPVSPTTAFKLGESAKDPLAYLGDIFTVPANLAGLPSISIPCGKDKQGLPIGMQLTGKAFDDGKLIEVARRYAEAKNV